jgi:hypothetical protein
MFVTALKKRMVRSRVWTFLRVEGAGVKILRVKGFFTEEGAGVKV